ncbi:MAG: hypothetical protein WCB49_14010, partial [Gammaproteobacteria bacterium]
WLRRLWRATLRSRRNAWVLGPTIGVFIYLWPLLPTGSFFSNWNAVTFWLVLAWALASARVYGDGVNPAVARYEWATPQLHR